MSVRAVALSWLAVGCAPAPPPVSVSDPEAFAVDLIGARLREAPGELASRFVPERDPATFPLRLLADRPEDLKLESIERLQTIDARVLVTARVAVHGQATRFDFWLEAHDGAWRVGGWESAPRLVALDATEANVPSALVAAAFREPHASPVLTTPGPAEPKVPDDVASRTVVVHLKPPELSGDCDPKALGSKLARLTAPLEACYQAAFGDEAPRAGRLTWTIVLPPDAKTAEVSLVETTLLRPALMDCAAQRLATLSRAGGATACTLTLRATFTPRGP